MGCCIKTLNGFNGIEKYEFSDAKIYAVRKGANIKETMIWLEVETEQKPIQSFPDTADFKINPSVEIILYISDLNLNEFGTQKLGFKKRKKILQEKRYTKLQ